MKRIQKSSTPLRSRGRRASRRGLVLALTGSVTILLVGGTPAMAAESGTVDAEVTVARAAACLEVSTSSVSFGTLALGTENAAGTPEIVITNCGDGDETLFASGTDAIGTNAAWTLTDSSATCATTLGTDNYRLGLTTPAGASVATLSTGNKELATLAAGEAPTHVARISTACPGSTGSGTTMSMQINYLVTNVEAPPIVLETIPMTEATADAAADYLVGGTRDVAVASSCGADPAIACVGGTPVEPPAQVRVVGTDVVTTEVAGQDRWDASATLAVTTPTSIPVSHSVAGTCQLAINTGNGASPTIALSTQLQFRSYPDPAGSKNNIAVANTQLTGLEAADVSLTGSFACTLAGSFTSIVLDSLTSSLEDEIGGALCGDPESDSFIACPALP